VLTGLLASEVFVTLLRPRLAKVVARLATSERLLAFTREPANVAAAEEALVDAAVAEEAAAVAAA
jgi:hypothetical protein